jgi:hypothetical protein
MFTSERRQLSRPNLLAEISLKSKSLRARDQDESVRQGDGGKSGRSIHKAVMNSPRQMWASPADPPFQKADLVPLKGAGNRNDTATIFPSCLDEDFFQMSALTNF